MTVLAVFFTESNLLHSYVDQLDFVEFALLYLILLSYYSQSYSGIMYTRLAKLIYQKLVTALLECLMIINKTIIESKQSP